MQCPELLLGSEAYFAIILFVVGAVVNGIKRISWVPRDALPVVAFALGWQIDAAIGNLACNLSYTAAALSGLGGGIAGLGAAGGHEALMRTATLFGFEKPAAKLLGKAKGEQDKRTSKKNSTVLLVLVLALSGCTSALATVAKVAHVAGDALEIIDAAATGAKKYLARHPSLEKEDAVGVAVGLVRAAVESNHKEAAVDLYADLLELLDDTGITSATPPDGGGETDAPQPEPLTLATVEEFEGSL